MNDRRGASGPIGRRRVSAPRRHWSAGLKAAAHWPHVGAEPSLQNKASGLRSDMADVHIRQRQSSPLSPRRAAITQMLIGRRAAALHKHRGIFNAEEKTKKIYVMWSSSLEDVVDRFGHYYCVPHGWGGEFEPSVSGCSAATLGILQRGGFTFYKHIMLTSSRRAPPPLFGG